MVIWTSICVDQFATISALLVGSGFEVERGRGGVTRTYLAD